jgi:hypothetical protein
LPGHLGAVGLEAALPSVIGNPGGDFMSLAL